MLNTRIGFIISEKYLNDLYPQCLVDYCIEKGHEVEIIVPELKTMPSESNCSIYIHRNHTNRGLNFLNNIEKYSLTLNPYSSVIKCQDKKTMQKILNNSELYVPNYFAIDNRSEISVEEFPIIAKPIYGNNGNGIKVFYDFNEWKDSDIKLESYIIQKYIINKEYDIKIYYINGDIFAVKKQSPIHKYQSIDTELISCTTEMKIIAEKCSQLFNLNVFGVDTIIDSNNRLCIIEVNECSSFSKVPNLNEIMYRLICEKMKK